MHAVSDAADRARHIPPLPHDSRRARATLEEWLTTAQAGRMAEGPIDLSNAEAALLRAVFGNSPFLSRCALAEPAVTLHTLRAGPDAALAALFDPATAPAEESLPGLMRALRLMKRRAALIIALADIGGLWDVERVVHALTDLADHTVRTAVDGLLAIQIAAGTLSVADPARPSDGSGYVVIGMGKLGAGELNYSSDIDLIVLYDPDRTISTGRRSLSELFVRLTRDLVKVLQERTEDGYVFRTDLRLRPDAGATPIAIPVPAAETYYESVGQNWERAAMIKARPVAGDLAVGFAFLDHIRPFVWRRHLDFAAVHDVHAMTRLIRSHHGFGQIAVPGHDIKLGVGGIREIEFFAQIHQLIAGGRQTRLREPTTLGVLRQLAADGQIQPATAESLRAAYLFLRRLEHRLQMIHDEQTQTLPTSPDGLAHVATFMGFDDPAAFETTLLGHLRQVAEAYNALLDTASAASRHGDRLTFDLEVDGPEALEGLRQLGFQDPQRVIERVRAWPLGRYAALHSERARTLLRGLIPTMLETFGRSPEPDAALAHFDDFLSRLPAGVQLFSLINANPRLLDLLAHIMSGAAALAEALTRKPNLLEAVLEPGFHTLPTDLVVLERDLGEMLRGGRDYQDLLDLTRRWCNERKFQVGVQLLLGQADGAGAGNALSAVAEAVLRALVPAVEREFAVTHGTMPAGELAILAMGKLGAREMTLSSDLDLIIIYDAPEGAMSDGARPLSAPDYYARLSKRLINAITVLTGEGRLYEVDMRLRPSGSQGPIAVSCIAFEEYQRHKAWIWERMALTRARPIWGAEPLVSRVQAAVVAAISRPEATPVLAAAVAEMREKMAERDQPSDPWNVKAARGGLIDLEFIAQFLILREAGDHPGLITGTTADALRALGAAGVLDSDTAWELADTARLMLDIQHMLRLWGREAFTEDAAPKGLVERLTVLFGLPGLAALRAELVARETRVRAAFQRIVEQPALTATAGSAD